MSMRAIVVGVDGLIGGALLAELRARGENAIGTTRRRERVRAGDTFFFDLLNPEIEEFRSADVVFICAAMTGLAECRRSPQLAERVICTAPVGLSAFLASNGARVVFLSTSAVLDCKEPLMRADRFRGGTSIYGRYKAEAESRILALGRLATVVRLTKVLTPQQALLKEWVGALQAGRSVDAFDDHRISPIAVRDAVDALAAIGRDGGDGVYQVSGASDWSYREIASHIAVRLGADPNLVHGCSAADRGIPVDEILSFTSLDTSRLSDLSGFRAPKPHDVVDTVLSLSGH
jgi:dTDP-4-dehydrorhamnose reductase